MALNFGGGGGDYLPYLKFNAKAGRFYTKQGDNEVEIANPTFVADFANIKTGWASFVEGQAPNWVFDPDLSTPAAKPSDKHKRGFKLNVFSKASFGGAGLVEFGSASMHACAAVNEVYSAYEKEASANVGKLPVVACVSITPQKDKMGTNYRPVFQIQKWVDAPVEFTSGVSSSNNVTDFVAPAPKVVNEF